ncbi:hypothetical protein MOB86_06390 [Bacillus haynesii]|nr:hypothetical protein [Bacillus haynesii]MCY8003841.1 hypothetical protein [Bacillus haynesii]MCY8099521.1 hypothetical protein [Bacillus haynesii]MCY8467712.1 hypothetical protein [Bacillus haynesii]
MIAFGMLIAVLSKDKEK